MPAWLEGIPTILSLSAVAVVSALFALWIAHLLGLHRKGRHGATSSRSPDAMVERLASLADVAKREGLLSLEEKLDPHQEPLVACAVALALEGAPMNKIQEALDAEVDAAAARRSGWARTFASISHLPYMLTISGCALLLITLISHAQDPAGTGLISVSAGVGLFLMGLLMTAAVPALVSTLPEHAAAQTYYKLLQSTGAILICSGADSHRVRTQLQGLLPQACGRSHLAKAA